MPTAPVLPVNAGLDVPVLWVLRGASSATAGIIECSVFAE
jgi:hypothetical protein